MRCYSHLSDDEREQIGLARALGHSIGAIAQAIGRWWTPMGVRATVVANLARLQVGVSVAAVSERPLQYSSARGTVRPWPFNDSRHASRKGRPLGARQMGFRDG